MRLFLWLLALMAAAIGIAVTARFNPGNVVLFYPPYRVDLSLNFFVLLQVLLFILLYLLVRAVRATVRMPAQVAAYRYRKRERDSNKGLREALKALFEGRFGRADRRARRAPHAPVRAPRQLAGPCRRRQQPENGALDDGNRIAGRRPSAGSGPGRRARIERQRHAPHPRAAMVVEGRTASKELAGSAAPGALARQAPRPASRAVVAFA